jgi:hypothetical protein
MKMAGTVDTSAPARFASEEPLPRYAFVPGLWPHPITDPDGHSYGHRHPTPPRPDPARWREAVDYLHGVDLFNLGFHWEAHEAWEALWNACGRTGDMADFFRALIHLTAAGVKVRQRMPAGVRSHGRQAADVFRVLAAREGAPARFFGLDLAELADFADAVAARADDWPPGDADAPVAVVVDRFLRPHEDTDA